VNVTIGMGWTMNTRGNKPRALMMHAVHSHVFARRESRCANVSRDARLSLLLLLFLLLLLLLLFLLLLLLTATTGPGGLLVTGFFVEFSCDFPFSLSLSLSVSLVASSVKRRDALKGYKNKGLVYARSRIGSAQARTRAFGISGSAGMTSTILDAAPRRVLRDYLAHVGV